MKKQLPDFLFRIILSSIAIILAFTLSEAMDWFRQYVRGIPDLAVKGITLILLILLLLIIYKLLLKFFYPSREKSLDNKTD